MALDEHRSQPTLDEPEELEPALRALLNRHCLENTSNTPDFILARYVLDSLDAFNLATQQRDEWFGVATSSSDRPDPRQGLSTTPLWPWKSGASRTPTGDDETSAKRGNE